MYNTLQGLDLFRFGKVADLILGAPTRVFRLGTTGLRPAFSLVTNPTRDIQTYAMQSRESNPAKLFANYVTALAEAMNPKRVIGKRNADLDLFYRLNANLSQPLGVDTAITRRTAKELFQGKTARIVRHPVEMLRELLSVSESVPRVAEIRNVAKEINWDGESPLTFDQAVQLGLGAKQVTVDFSAMGSIGKKLNQAIPFFNANIQGQRQFLKAFRDHPMRSIAYGSTFLLAPTLALWWANKDKEWYKDMPSYEKFMYWNIEAGDKILQIPRGFEWGNTFATIPETLLDSWYTQDPQGLKDAAGYVFDTSTPPLLPHTLQVAKEEWQNRIDFFDKPIVPKSELDMKPGDQRGAGTSELAKVLGDYFPNTVSPRRVDHLIRGLGGGTASDVVKMVEQITGVRPTNERTASDIPAIGKLFRPGGQVGYNSKTIDKFYQEYENISLKVRSKDKTKADSKRYGEAQAVARSLKFLREQNMQDTSAEGRQARNLLMREIVKKFLAGERQNLKQYKTTKNPR